MKHSLLHKFIICYIIVAISMFAILNTYGVKRIQHSLIEGKKAILYEEAGIISSEYLNNFYQDKLSITTLTTQLRTIDTFLNTRIWIVQKDGTVILDTQNANITNQNFNINYWDSSFLEKTFSQTDVFQEIFEEEMLSVIYPVNMNYELKGYIVLHTSIDAIESDCIYYIDMINICFLIFLIVMFLVFAYIYYVTVRPVHTVTKGIKEYADGHFDYIIPMKSQDEYRVLANSVMYLANRIKNLDDYQKKFVANISHDFRSPLTSIKGYAEAMKDGTIPPEMHEKYLGIIQFETERLNKLTSELLELNRFENNGIFLEISSFDINRVIKQTAQSFEGSCTKKNISLNLIFSAKELFVDADVSKIQQVLYNLIDNAIKFSHNESVIKISTEEQNGKVFVSVKDYGIGVPKDSTKKVFDRFYKTDLSRGKDKKGTGLGLSITKEIINAHNENINLISTEGVGSEFIFTLKESERKESV